MDRQPTNPITPINTNIIYKDLSYRVVGMAYDVYNDLGYGYQEKYYQRAYAELLKESNLNYQRELLIPIKFKEKIIGRYFIDFVVENKIAVEFKVAEDFYHQHFKQLSGYLKAQNLQLGILILFTKLGIKYKRIINNQFV